MKKECCNINEIVQEFYNYLKSYISSKVNNKTIAEDIVQEVMMKLIESHQNKKEIKNMVHKCCGLMLLFLNSRQRFLAVLEMFLSL